MKKKIFFLSILLSLVFTTTVFADNVLKIGLTNDPEGLDPHRTVSASTFEISNNIYDTLVGVTSQGEVVSRLAEKWLFSDNGLVITFYLRKDVKFHNGQQLTAEDVRYSFNRLKDDQSPRAGDYANISDIIVKDTYTITFKTKKLDVALLSSFAYPWTAIVEKGTADQLKNEPVGTGPFKLEKWIPQQELILVKNKDYYGEEPQLDQVIFKIMPSNTSQLNSLRAGELDIITVSGDQAVTLKNHPDIKLLKTPSNTVQIMALNNQNPALADQRVRQAIALAIDKSAVIEGANWGFGDKIGSHMPTSSPYYIDTNSVLGYNPVKARQLLKEAGYQDGLHLKLSLPKPYKLHVDSGQIIAEQLKKIGIDLKIDIVEWGTWVNDIYLGRNYETTIIGHTGRLDPYVLLRRYQSDSNENYFNYHNDKIDNLLAAAQQERDTAKRKEIFAEIQQILAEQVPAAYLQTPYTLMAMKKNVMGMKIYPIDVYQLQDVYLK